MTIVAGLGGLKLKMRLESKRLDRETPENKA
jgi:hypothetical protein